MSDWIMRMARPQDAQGLAECVAVAYQRYVPRMVKPPGLMLANYAEEIAQHQVWVAEANGEMIRAREVGCTLLELADAEAMLQGYGELHLYTHETMTENIALYTRIGWIETHRGEQDGYARVLMRKPLLP